MEINVDVHLLMDDVDDGSMYNKDVHWQMIDNDDDELIYYYYLDLVAVVERLLYRKNVQNRPDNRFVDDRDDDDNVDDNVDNFVAVEYSMHALIHNNLWLTMMMMNVE